MICVIGDIILDEYVYGTATRLSQEAPVPVISYERTEYRLGGAANVAANIKSLGGNVVLLGSRGDDPMGNCLSGCLQNAGIERRLLLNEPNRPTTHKTRFIVNGQQLARIDKENATPDTDVAEFIGDLFYSEPKAIIVSDYAKGFINTGSLERIHTVAQAQNIPVYMDPKAAHTDIYKDLNWIGNVVTPNIHEAEAISGIRINDKVSLEQAGRYIVNRFGCGYVLLTRGEHGMALFSHDGLMMLDLPTEAKDVFDVSGAGDTVIATLAYARSLGHPMEDAARLANKAAGIVVGKRGTATVSQSELDLRCPTLEIK